MHTVLNLMLPFYREQERNAPMEIKMLDVKIMHFLFNINLTVLMLLSLSLDSIVRYMYRVA